MTVALIVRPSAATAVEEEFSSVEPFDAWAFDPRLDLHIGLDGRPLPSCTFLPHSEHTPEMHEFDDLFGNLMECVGCGRLERWEE